MVIFCNYLYNKKSEYEHTLFTLVFLWGKIRSRDSVIFFSIEANFYDFSGDTEWDTVRDFAKKFSLRLNQQNYQHWARNNFDLKIN